MARSSRQPVPIKSLPDVARELGLYPMEAFSFVAAGVTYTVSRVHRGGKRRPEDRHVTGRQLCEGLRGLAIKQWGYLARTVLERWNIRGTEDFGRIVFALVESGHLSKTDQDRLEDFREVYDFHEAFEQNYRFELRS